MSKPKWLGPIPTKCQVCGGKISTYFVDGQVRGIEDHRGQWALMCSMCHNLYGIGLGIGRGQKYSAKTGYKIGG